MKSKVVLVGLFLFLTILIDAQVLSYPSYMGRSNHSMNIVKVKKTKKGLALEMKHHAAFFIYKKFNSYLFYYEECKKSLNDNVYFYIYKNTKFFRLIDYSCC